MQPDTPPSTFSGSASFVRPHGASRDVHWEVNDFRVQVIPPNNFNDLTDVERVSLFNDVLASVRKRSEHPDKFYSAALAVTDSGDIFVANNTQRQHEFHKDCAEMNLANVIRQLNPSAKISSLYLMAGPNIEGPIKPFAPCGKCMDTLCSCSMPDAVITMLPVNDGRQPVEINREATRADDVLPGTAWETRLMRLKIDSVLPLDENARMHAEAGWKALASGSALPAPLSAAGLRRIQGMHPKKLNSDDRWLKTVMERAAENAALGRRSEAELDADPSPASINRFMVREITKAYHSRPPALLPGQHEAEAVRCVVVRLADGSFRSAIEVEGPHENAVPHAEITAVAGSREKNQPITDVWVMSMNRRDIAHSVMRTSPKESVERLNKKNPKAEGVTDYAGKPIRNSINLHYISFNDGTLQNDEVEKLTRHFSSRDLFPSDFRGSKHEMRLRQENGHGQGACL